jgi:3,4-dihydroxyphenylacetate 2,3-dioxygenase
MPGNPALGPEYGTLVPMRYMNADGRFKAVSVSALCTSHYLHDSARLGWAMRRAVDDHYDGTDAFFASGSPQRGQWQDFSETLPEYALKGRGEGFMHDTAMLLGLLGWTEYDGRAEVITPYLGSSGTGQISAVFPVTPQRGRAIPEPVASRADRSASIAARL